MSNRDRKLYWEVVCERDGEPYCSSVIEAMSAEEALRNFHNESAVARLVQVVAVKRLGSYTSALSVLLDKVSERPPR